MNDLENNIPGDLFRWNKPNKFNSKLNSKIKESDNIQLIHQWMRKIEDASETAINKALNPKQETNSLIKRSKSNFSLNEKRNLSQIQDQIIKKTDPYSDAHDLISEWITDKIRLDLDDDFYDYVNIGEVNQYSDNEKFLKDLKKELLDNDVNNSVLDIKGIDYDKYDENYIAKDILNKIMKKKIIDPKRLLTSDVNKPKTIDTQLKIEMRHQAVKENREKRTRELEQIRKEKLERKEIEYQARQIVLKEENEKKMREDLEKQLIEQEAQRLRLEMAEKRRKDEEIRKQQRELDRSRKEKEQQELMKIEKKFESNDYENVLMTKRNEMAEKRANDLADSLLKIKRLRFLQKSFSVWYGMILDLRIKNGKAKALADWKLSYKIFNGWKKNVLVGKLRKEQENHHNEIRRENLKMTKAIEFNHKTIIQKAFNAWSKHAKNELLVKKLNEDKVNVKNRMARFLEAAKEDKTNTNESELSHDRLLSNRSEYTNFSQNLSTENSTARSNYRIMSASKRKIPYKKDSDRSQMQDDNDEEFKEYMSKKSDIDVEKKVKSYMQPWLKNPTVKIFDNRFKAQEKILNEQSKMIKDQQKLIEELKYQQSQLAFKEQISLLEEIKAKQIELEKMQKAQFAQEKKILRIQSQTKQNTPRKGDELNEDILDVLDTPIVTNRVESSQVDDSENVKTGLNVKKFDKITLKMQERSKQREMLKKEREEKRKKLEQEKLELLKAQQEEKLKIEEEEKRKKMEELREKKRIQKLVEDKKNNELQKEKESIQKADDFYKKHLLRYYCMNGFKKLIEQKNEKMCKAENHHRQGTFKIIFIEWRTLIRAEVIVKQKKADEFYNKCLIRHAYFDGIKRFKQSIKIGNAKAVRFYNFNIKLKLYKHLITYVSQEREKNRNYEILITEHNLSRIKTNYFKIWKEYPKEAKKMREREKRLQDLRYKVKQLIPDYESPDNKSL